MKRISRYKTELWLPITIVLFAIISILTIWSATSLLPSYLSDLALKQMAWYFVGFILVYFMMFLGKEWIYKYAWYLYIIGTIFLVLLLFFGEEINNARCWFSIPGIGTIQPSEFMKIILIITLGRMIEEFHLKYKNPSIKEELLFLLKVGIIVLIPSILTFLEPDTGVVLIYLLITITMLFISGIRYRWFLLGLSIIALFLTFLLLLYFFNKDLFVKIFGTSFFLRIDRLLDWSNTSGFQLEHGMSAIGSGGLLGNGFNNTPIYFPEPQTDFIFAVYASNFGFLGSCILISLILFFDIKLIFLAIHSREKIDKYVISGILGMLLYQQFQNIGMTFGLMPITGITLPFISYGGSSLLSYMIMIGIIFNISNSNLRYTN
ncbi:MAG: FtsW/RodA/SpoVE family cell cycle protein [Bacilli bacterium]|nr:FtsW/RodA/SpoVE family cell cycle protein [Bacilli bacterium]